ncbi:MAG: response regulator [Chromatiales bacterium]|nr:response regulator [Gammaproteobacteria bacterium]
MSDKAELSGISAQTKLMPFGYKILFVDDEPNILNAYQRQLRNRFQLTTALSGREGLEIIQKEGPFSVVVADMRMPEMDGITFLEKVQEVAPDSVRLMLTGNADQQTAIDAVNKGNVFRFMTKPWPHELLVSTLEAAQKQYHLIHAEREVLEGTLNGSIKLLLEILSIAVPSISDRTVTLRETAIGVAHAMQVFNTWELETAAMLSHIAYITLPPETLAKTRSGEQVSEAEQQIIDHLPETGHKLLANIPRLERVAKIILYQDKNFDGSGVPFDAVSGEDIPIEARILKVLHSLKDLEERDGLSADLALEQMQETSDTYDPQVLQAAAKYLITGEDELPHIDVDVSELQAGQVLVSNVETEDGRLLFTAGNKLSGAIIEKLINYHQVQKIREPIQVFVTG